MIHREPYLINGMSILSAQVAVEVILLMAVATAPSLKDSSFRVVL